MSTPDDVLFERLFLIHLVLESALLCVEEACGEGHVAPRRLDTALAPLRDLLSDLHAGRRSDA